MLDDLSDDHVVLGAALGYQQREFDALNSPVEGRITRFVDFLKLVRRLFRDGDVSFNGETYELSDFAHSPRPVQDGSLPIWVGGNADPALQ